MVDDSDDGTALALALVRALADQMLDTAKSSYTPGEDRDRQAKSAADATRAAFDAVEIRVYQLCEALRETRLQLDTARTRAEDKEDEAIEAGAQYDTLCTALQNVARWNVFSEPRGDQLPMRQAPDGQWIFFPDVFALLPQ